MQLTVEHPKAREMAEELARLTGESVGEAVVHALEARLEEERGKSSQSFERKRARIEALVERVKTMPVYDDRHPDEMLYDESGLPKARDDA